MKRLILILILTLVTGLFSQIKAQDVKKILQTSEEKRRGIESSKASMTMKIYRPKWSEPRTMSMTSWSKGDDYALILITAPKSESGVKTLKRGKEVWNWLPRIEKTMKLPPSMMSQSWMGSDLSNDDLVREVSLIDDYDSRILGEETIEERKCWKIELIPHEDVAIVWGKIIMSVDQKDYLQLKTEFYDEDDVLVNRMSASQISNMGGRVLANKIEIIPLQDKGHKTVLEYNSIEFDKQIPESFFSLRNLKTLRQ